MHVLFANIATRYIKPPQQPWSGGLRLAFDVEANDLLDAATKIHCVCIIDLDGNDATEYGSNEIHAALKHLARAEVLIGHNALCYDLPLLKKLCDWSPPAECTVRDTLILSRLILPHIGELDDQMKRITQARMQREGVPITKKTDGGLGALRGSHSIEAWGARLGIAKVGADIEDFSVWSPELQARCASDIKICKAIWHLLKPEGYSEYAIQLEHRVAPICEEIEAGGAPFDCDAAMRLAEHLEAKRSPLKAALKRQFPDLNLNSNKQIIALLEARGWKTDQRTKTGKAKLDAEALESVAVVYPEFAGLAEHKKLTKLLALLKTGKEALTKHVAEDGRIHGRVTHMRTPHSRASHSKPNLAQIPNPKKGTLWGAECRSLFRAPAGWVSVSADQNGLQDRGLAHYLAPHDGGAYAASFAAGTDTHWRSAIALGLVAEGTARDKADPTHTALREGAKRFRYAFLYGVGAEKAGTIIYETCRSAHNAAPEVLTRFFSGTAPPGASALKRVGKQAIDRFIASTPGLSELREKLAAFQAGHQWLPGLDGRRVPASSQRVALNYVVTSAEAIICKKWLINTYAELREHFAYGWDGDVVIVLWVHDEISCCCKPEIADQVGEILVRNALEPATFYRFKTPLAAEYTVAPSWNGPIVEVPPVGAVPLQPAAPAEDDPTDGEQVDDASVEDESAEDEQGVDAEERDDDDESVDDEPVNDADLAEIRAVDASIIPPIPATPASRPITGGQGNGYDAADYTRSPRDPGAPLITYIYNDEEGNPHHRKIRTTTKNFWQSHWVNGQWVKGAPTRKYLYAVGALLAAPAAQAVWVCEGEKDTTTLRGLSLLAVTNPGGAGKWTVDFTPEQISHWFKGRQTVYVLEDNDPPGHLHAEQVARSLHGLVAEIRIVGFREMPAHGDVSDWLALGHTKAELVARAQAALRYDAVESFAASTLQPMKFAPMRFVVPDFITEGLTLFAGKPKIGKSWLLLHAAWAVAAGETTLGEIQCEQGDVFYAALEDNKRRLQRRLQTLVGDTPWPARLYFACEMKKLADGGLAQIKRWIGEVPRPRLIIIDTLKMVRSPAGKNQSFYEADYESVKELRDLAAAYNIAIVVVHHLRKAEAEDPFDTVSGTLGLTGAVDTIMLLKREGNGIILAAKGRDVEEIVKAMEFERETCTWTIVGDATTVKLTSERQTVLDALAEAGSEPIGPNQIALATGMKATNVRRLLGKLRAEGMFAQPRYGQWALIGAEEFVAEDTPTVGEESHSP